MQPDVPFVRPEQEVEPAVAIAIGALRERPGSATRGWVSDVVAGRQERLWGELALPPAAIDGQTAEYVPCAIAIPVEELEARDGQGQTSPGAREGSVVDGESGAARCAGV